MSTNWGSLTLGQHILKSAALWFFAPFTKSLWKEMFDDADEDIGFKIFVTLFVITLWSIAWATGLFVFPIVCAVSRIVCVRRARNLVINALRTK